MSFKKFREIVKTMPPLTELQKKKLLLSRHERDLELVERRLGEFRAWSIENQKRARDDREYGTCSEDCYTRSALIKQIAKLKEEIACLEAEISV